MSDKDRAADYVMGTLSAQERAEAGAQPPRDPALAREIDALSAQLSPLLLDAPRGRAAGRTVRPHQGPRIAETAETAKTATRHSPGSHGARRRRPLGAESAPASSARRCTTTARRSRITFLIRAQPGAEFPAHQHDDDEEAYVLTGDLSFDDLVLGAGDYHLARPGVRHPVGRTPRQGCMLLITAAA